MAESFIIDKKLPKEEKYKTILEQINYLFDSDDYILTSLSNFTAVIKESFDSFSWIGFYFLKENFLCLGPFQGKIACTKIEIGKGVCGTSFNENKTIIVPDVNQFPGHIACDSNSRSEIVIPLNYKQKLFGVLDIDSTFYNNFDDTDKFYLEKICNSFLQKFNLNNFIFT